MQKFWKLFKFATICYSLNMNTSLYSVSVSHSARVYFYDSDKNDLISGINSRWQNKDVKVYGKTLNVLVSVQRDQIHMIIVQHKI